MESEATKTPPTPPTGGDKRAQQEEFIPPPPTKSSPSLSTGGASTRIAERARLSLRGARAVAGKTLQRWTSNIATTAALTGTTALNAASGAASAAIASTTQYQTQPHQQSQTQGVATTRVSRVLDLSDSGLLRISARPPGCLFDEKFMTRLVRELRTEVSEKKHRVLEVQFLTKAVGLTLDISRTYPERIYVDGFSSDESPALLSNTVMVGDTLLSAAGGDRWLRSTGDLDEMSKFVRDCPRPVIIRFLRDLHPPLTLNELHADPLKAAFWIDFLVQNSTGGGLASTGISEGSDPDQVYAVDPQTQLLRSIWDGKVLAQFALDARFSDRTEEAVEAIVERHLPMARTPAEQSLIDWYKARKYFQRQNENRRRKGGSVDEPSETSGIGSETLTLSEPKEEDSLSQDGLEQSRSTASSPRPPPPPPPPRSMSPGLSALDIPVLDFLEVAGKQMEEALSQAYFKRFLHSKEALSLLQEFQIPYERPMVKACATLVSLEAVLSRRSLANLFLAHCLPRYRNVHPKLLLWMELEYSLRPALETAEEVFAMIPMTIEHGNGISSSSDRSNPQVKLETLKAVWTSAARIYERFLSPKGACYCGELSNNANANLWAVCSSLSREKWGETGFCSTCGRESRELIQDLEARVNCMEHDPMDVGFISLDSLRTLLISMQQETLEFLRDPFSQFCQDPSSWFPVVVEGFNLEVSSADTTTGPASSTTASVIPRFSAVLQHGNPLPHGIEAHRAPTDYNSSLSTWIAPDVKSLARFRYRRDTNQVDVIECFGEPVPDHLGKFCFPWVKATTPIQPSGNKGNASSPQSRVTSGSLTQDEEVVVDEASSIIKAANMAQFLGRDNVGSLCFNFVLGSEKLRGVALVTQGSNGDADALMVISERPLIDRLRHILETYWDRPEEIFLAPEDLLVARQLKTPYGLAKARIDSQLGAVTGEMVSSEGMTLPFSISEVSLAEMQCEHCGRDGPFLEELFQPGGGTRRNFWFPTSVRRDLSLGLLLESLSPRNLIQVFAAMILEKKLLLVSSRYTVLTAVGESLCSLLYPLQWSHVYGPLLPRQMLDLLMCPTPFLVGIHSSYAFKSDFPFATDLIVVNLDTDEVAAPSAVRLPPLLERSLLEKIKRTLSPLSAVADQDFRSLQHQPPLSTVERDRRIELAFRETMLDLLSHVHLCCFSVEHRGEHITFIDENSWLKSRRGDEQSFCSAFLRTQAFSTFVGGMQC